MNNFSPTSYMSPKWRAYVTPNDRSFTFANGIKVASMWELKQALLTLPEDIIVHHVRDEQNDIATWVEHVVGDKEMADEMRKYKHRWGMIVALERQMMRTVDLPDFVAKRWTAKVDNGFTFMSGEVVNSLAELASAFGKITDETVAFHCERHPNDMAVWVLDIIGDYVLAEMLTEATSRLQMQRNVEDHLEMLAEASE